MTTSIATLEGWFVLANQNTSRDRNGKRYRCLNKQTFRFQFETRHGYVEPYHFDRCLLREIANTQLMKVLARVFSTPAPPLLVYTSFEGWVSGNFVARPHGDIH